MGDKVKIVGKRHADYTNRKGERVVGDTFYYEMAGKYRDMEGVYCGEAWINAKYSSENAYMPEVGDECICVYNGYGSVVGFMPLS